MYIADGSSPAGNDGSWKSVSGAFEEKTREIIIYVENSNLKNPSALVATMAHAKQGKLLAFINDSLTQIQGAYCSSCGCPLSAKVRSNDICPENKW